MTQPLKLPPGAAKRARAARGGADEAEDGALVALGELGQAAEALPEPLVAELGRRFWNHQRWLETARSISPQARRSLKANSVLNSTAAIICATVCFVCDIVPSRPKLKSYSALCQLRGARHSGISYAPNGALLASTDSENGAYAFATNDLNQLVSACNPSCTGYAFDRYGNRWA